MFKILYPYEYVESVHTIDYQKLYHKGFRAIIFDIDNTLAHHGQPPKQNVLELFKILRKIGFETLLLSNNSKERIDNFNQHINSKCLYNANKPDKTTYLNAINSLGLPKEQIIFIGDQIFTDILGANRVGLPNILVKFMRKKNEVKFGKRRQVEKIILNFYKRSKRYYARLDGIEKTGE